MITVIGIAGFTGRMGQSIADVIKSHPNACLAGGLTRSELRTEESSDENPLIFTNNPDELFPHCDVIIDFTHASATPELARAAAKAHKPYLCGTTGLDANTKAVLKEVSEAVPVLYASNTSLSLIVVKKLVTLASQLLKDHDYDISVLDRHHKWKKDAPSGTALTLGEAARAGDSGKHPVTYASVRCGAIVGEHEILFGGNGEYINIQHQVTDRRVFARGAVEAAMWLAKKQPGYYSMDDVLSITP